MKTLQMILIILVLVIGQVAVVTHAAEVKLTASDAAAGDYFGVSVSISGDYAIVGARGNDDAGGESGSAYIFVRSGTSWNQQAKLTASDAARADHFGFSVSISGNYAIVGAYSDSDAGSSSGSAYIFVRSGTSWSQQAKLTASDAAAGDYFGYSVSISGDYAIVGAGSNDDAGSGSGSAYIFVRSGTNWTEQAKLTASDAAAGDNFGGPVSISGDYAIIGAYVDDDAGSNSGSAYIFFRSGTSWTEQAKLTASDAAAGDYFGYSVSISGDYAIVGASYDDDAGSDSGSAYSFLRSGSSWSQKAKVTASDAAAGDNFGNSVSISGDYAIIGAYVDDDAGTASGSAYIYHSIDDLSLPVELSVFTATTSGDNVILKWRTESEVNNLGFDIYRSDSKEGPYTKVNSGLIQGAGTDATPHDYSFADENVVFGKTYYYYIEDVDFSGETNKSHIIEVTVGKQSIKTYPIPLRFVLLQNYPNPFNPETWLPYELAQEATVTIRIYDVKGQLVRQLDLGVQKVGRYVDKQKAAYWDGKNQTGKAVSSGLYFYTLEAGDFQATRRMLIVK